MLNIENAKRLKELGLDFKESFPCPCLDCCSGKDGAACWRGEVEELDCEGFKGMLGTSVMTLSQLLAEIEKRGAYWVLRDSRDPSHPSDYECSFWLDAEDCWTVQRAKSREDAAALALIAILEAANE